MVSMMRRARHETSRRANAADADAHARGGGIAVVGSPPGPTTSTRANGLLFT
jgi:hypothetical protein